MIVKIVKKIIKLLIPDSTFWWYIRGKRIIRRLLSRKKLIETKYHIVEFSRKRWHTFFGYYDITPFGADDLVIYQEVKNENTPSNIIVNDINNTSKRIIAHSNAWNWQQGSRLRWFPGVNTAIIFNDFIDNCYVSRIIDINTLKEKRLKFPLYDISKDGSIGITLDFNRLGYLRPGYGYINQKRVPIDIKTEGIHLVDLKEDRMIRTITYEEIANLLELDNNTAEDWYLNHLSFRPDGNGFIFFLLTNITNYFFAYLLYYDIIQNCLTVLEKENCSSHYSWIDNENLICTGYSSREHLYDTCLYYVYNVSDNTRRKLCSDTLTEDGHPSYYLDNKLITDCYPDSDGYQHIYDVDINTGNKKTICSVFDYLSIIPERRTDLHPRINKSGNMVSFDANTSGYRFFYIVNKNV